MIGAVLVLLASCKKESDIGLDVQPDSDLLGLNAMDSLSLTTYTVKEDSIRTDESNIIQIGSMTDPQTGEVSAGLFTQFTIPNTTTDLNFSGWTFDSAVVQLRYDFDFYGDTADAQDFTVYQITEDLHKDSSYYSNHEKQYYSFPVGSKTNFAPHPRLGTPVGSDTILPCLRIRLDSTWAENLFHPADVSHLANNTNFQEYFKGLYVKSTAHSNVGALLRFNPKDSLSVLRFYAHTATDTLKYDFVINSSTAYYNYFKHDFSGGNFSLVNQLANPGTQSMDYVFVEGASGLKTKIEFPTLASLQDTTFGRVIINKAELVLKADPLTSSTNLPINTQLYLVYLDSIGQSYVLTDMVESAEYYGGTANTSLNEYRINMARYFQRLVDGDLPNNGLYLKEYNAPEYGRRVVLGSSTNNGGYKMYLHIVYTRIN